MSRSTPWEPLELSRDMDKMTCYVGKFSKWLFPWASGSLGVAWDGKAGSAHMLSPSSSSFLSHQGAGRGKAGVKDQVWPPGSTWMWGLRGSEGMELAFP